MAKKVYLAGPDVFLPNAREIGRRKQEICAEFGFEGLFPLDNDKKVNSDAGRIFEANCSLMRKAEIGVFNCSPFRGPSVDAGTAFELGFLFRMGKPLWGYTYSATTYKARVNATLGTRKVQGRVVDAFGHLVENFELQDNLMLIEALKVSGGKLVTLEDASPKQASDPLAALGAFRECLDQLKKALAAPVAESIRQRRAHGRLL